MKFSLRKPTFSRNNRYNKRVEARKLRLEALEDRQLLDAAGLFAAVLATTGDEVPSTVVTTLDDTVDPDDGVISLREALDSAQDGDTITFDPSLKGETITLCGEQLTIGKSLSIDASDLWDAETDAPGLTISGAGLSRVFYITKGGVELDGLRISDGYTDTRGGGIFWSNGGTLTVSNSEIVNNVASQGGGISLTSGDVLFTNCVVRGNEAKIGGGIWSYNNAFSFSDGEVVDNVSSSNGGGAHLSNSVGTFVDSAILGNVGGKGGGLSLVNSEANMTNSLVCGNSATYGGGVYGSDSTGLFVNSTIANDSSSKANRGGGAYFSSGEYEFRNTIVAGNASNSDVVKSDSAVVNAYYTLSSFTDWNDASNAYVYDASLLLFANAKGGDYSVPEESQARDRGNDEYVQTATDIAGNPRVDGTVDLGAYEGSAALRETPSTVVTTLDDYVYANAYDGQITLREAIWHAGANGLGSTITFDPSLKGETITLCGEQLTIGKSLSIDASDLWDAETDAPGLTISGAGLSRVFYITKGGVELNGLRISDGYTDARGGGIFWSNGGTLTVSNSEIVNNVASQGGGLSLTSGDVLFTNCAVRGNEAKIGGGIWSYNNAFSFSDGEVADNVSSSNGGGAHLSNSVGTFVDSAILGNVGGKGGGLSLVNSEANMANSLVCGNSATYGGGVYGSDSTGLFVDSTIANNSSSKANRGGGAYLVSGEYDFHNTIVAVNASNSDIVQLDSAVVNARHALSSFVNWSDALNAYVYDASLPLFVDASNGDFSLAEGSQAIDKGSVDYVPAGMTTDIAGAPRVSGEEVDLGAYEYQGASSNAVLDRAVEDAFAGYEDTDLDVDLDVFWNALKR